MNSCSCSGSRAENSSASVRRFRTVMAHNGQSGWPVNHDYIEISVDSNGNERCELVYTNGTRETAHWSLKFATEPQHGCIKIVEIPVAPKVRYFQGANTAWHGKVTKPTDLLYLETDGASIWNLIQYNGEPRSGPTSWNLERALEFVATGTWIELDKKPAVVRYFKRNENDTWHKNVSHVKCVEGLCTWPLLNGTQDASGFGPDTFANHSSFTEVSEEPVVAAKAAPAPVTRWFVCASDRNHFIENIDDKSIRYNVTEPEYSEKSIHTLENVLHYVGIGLYEEVFERPKAVFKPRFADKPVPAGYRALTKGEKRRNNGDDLRWSETRGAWTPCEYADTYVEGCNFTVRNIGAKTDEELAAHLAEAAKPRVRWFIAPTGVNGPSFHYIECVGNTCTYHWADGPDTSDLTPSEISELKYYKEVFEKPVVTKPTRWFVQRVLTNTDLAFVSFTGGKGKWHWTNGDLSPISEFTIEDYLKDSNFKEVCEEPVTKPVVHDLSGWNPPAEEFWTVTDANTQATNSRSKRFDSEEAALAEATERVNRGVPRYADGVYVMKATKLVKRS